MARDAAATRERILTAATAEFAERGLAGARIDRIATAAEANPNSLYSYFGSKEQLFHVVVDRALRDLGEQVPLTPDDLPGFAGRMFDWLLAHPAAVRLSRWRFLEAPDAGPDDSRLYADLARSLSRSRADGSLPAADLLVLVPNMAASWVSTSRDLLDADGRDHRDPDRIADHRAALVTAVRRLQPTSVPPNDAERSIRRTGSRPSRNRPSS